jgi:transcriptional regulator with XRE-family HTH domain
MKPLDQLLNDRNLAVEDLAEQSKLPVERVVAILEGRWTPSPRDRNHIAGALDLSTNEIIWGHTMDPRNIRYRQFGQRDKS